MYEHFHRKHEFMEFAFWLKMKRQTETNNNRCDEYANDKLLLRSLVLPILIKNESDAHLLCYYLNDRKRMISSAFSMSHLKYI